MEHDVSDYEFVGGIESIELISRLCI